MPDLSKFKTAHQLAKDLLAGPDHIVVVPTPTFDMPGAFIAFPARAEATKVQETKAVAILPDIEALESSTQEKPEEPKPADQPPDAGHS